MAANKTEKKVIQLRQNNPEVFSPPRRGRPPGGVTIRSRAIASILLSDGELSPLEIVVHTARYYYLMAFAEKEVKNPKTKEITYGKRDYYLQLARDNAAVAVPFMHARLASVDLNNKDGTPFVIQLAHGDDEL